MEVFGDESVALRHKAEQRKLKTRSWLLAQHPCFHCFFVWGGKQIFKNQYCFIEIWRCTPKGGRGKKIVCSCHLQGDLPSSLCCVYGHVCDHVTYGVTTLDLVYWVNIEWVLSSVLHMCWFVDYSDPVNGLSHPYFIYEEMVTQNRNISRSSN